MKQVFLNGDPSVEINLRRSSRARMISLRVSELDGQVTLTVPDALDVNRALAFAEDRVGWIRKQLSRRTVPVEVRFGATIPVRGRDILIAPGSGTKAEIHGGRLVVPPQPDMVTSRVKAFLKITARSEFAGSCSRYSERLGLRHGKITLRDTRSRWGSCSAKGDLMFSWRLAMAPPNVLDYVAAHEVAHLAEMNHSPEFWAVVARLYPEHKEPLLWLKSCGRNLHRYRFGD